MTDKVKYTPLTPITSDSQLRRAVNDIIANLAPLTGQHRERGNQAVTWLDLINAGYEYDFDGAGDFVLPPVTGPEEPDTSTPPAVIDFTAVASFNYVTMSWGQPRYKNHSHVEIWRAEGYKTVGQGPNVPTVLGDAVFRIMSPSIVVSDTVLPGDVWRYWARNVSSAGVAGPWTSVDGLLVAVPESPAYIIDKISGEIRESDLYVDLSAKIDGSDKGVKSLQQLTDSSYTVKIDSGSAVAGFGLMTDDSGFSNFIIRSNRFAIAPPQQYDSNGKPIVVEGSFPFIVDMSVPTSPKTLIRNAYIDQAFIQTLVTGSLVADRITGETLTGTHIRGGDMVIGSNFNVDEAGSATMLNAFIKGTMQSNNYAAGSAGWQVRSDGYAEFRQAVVRGTIYADDGYFHGTVQADKMIGDVVTAKTVSVSASGVAAGTTVLASASVVGNRFKSATLMVQGFLLVASASGGQMSSGGTPTGASASGVLEVLNTAGTVIASIPFDVAAYGISSSALVPVNISAGFPVGVDAATITVRVRSVSTSIGSGGASASVKVPAQSVVFMLVPQGSQFV